MPVSAQTTEQITGLLNRYQTAYNNHDPAALAALLAADLLMYGCRTEETIIGRDACITAMQANFARYKTGGIRIGTADIKSEGIIAWLSAPCMLRSTAGNGTVHETPCRFTAVLRGTGHAWEFAQIHMSLGYPYHA